MATSLRRSIHFPASYDPASNSSGARIIIHPPPDGVRRTKWPPRDPIHDDRVGRSLPRIDPAQSDLKGRPPDGQGHGDRVVSLPSQPGQSPDTSASSHRDGAGTDKVPHRSPMGKVPDGQSNTIFIRLMPSERQAMRGGRAAAGWTASTNCPARRLDINLGAGDLRYPPPLHRPSGRPPKRGTQRYRRGSRAAARPLRPQEGGAGAGGDVMVQRRGGGGREARGGKAI